MLISALLLTLGVLGGDAAAPAAPDATNRSREELISRWCSAGECWQSMEGDIECWIYDEVFRTREIQNGRFVLEKPKCGFLELDDERWVWIDGQRHTVRLGKRGSVVETSQMVTPQLRKAASEGDWFGEMLLLIIEGERMTEYIISLVMCPDHASLLKNFDITISDHDESTLLTLRPRLETDQRHMKQLELLFDPAGDLPYACRITGANGKSQTVWEVRNLKLDGAAPDRASWLDPKVRMKQLAPMN